MKEKIERDKHIQTCKLELTKYIKTHGLLGLSRQLFGMLTDFDCESLNEA